VQSEYAAIHEVTDGPFHAEDGDFAPWAPTEDRALRAFLSRSLDQLLAHERDPAMAQA